MSKLQGITFGVIIATAVILGIYDILIAAKYGSENTISWVLVQAAHRWLAIPFGFGFLMGHFFAQFAGMIPAPVAKFIRRLIYVGGDRSNDFTERRL